jgi:hypothetical protein
MLKKISISLLLIVAAIAVAGMLVFRYSGFFKSVPREAQKTEIVKSFPFSQDNALKEWEEKIFRGKVIYRIEKNQSLDYVRATSDKTASALYYRIKLDVKGKSPVISWKWDVDKFPQKKNKESLETENEDDFAARVYVIFPAFFFTNSKVLEYIWAETLPEGLIGTSPYSKNIKLIVARSGPNKDKKWFTENRDIIADYVKAFGTKPEHDIGAVAFMTNTEHTGTSADAMYDDITLGYKKDNEEGK